MRPSRISAVAILAALTGAGAVAAADQAQGGPEISRPASLADTFVCGTPEEVRARRLGFTPRALSLPDGAPLWFDQQPSILSPEYTGGITLRDFMVLGDFAQVRFAPYSGPTDDFIETWDRTATTEINGQTISVFNPTWASEALDRALRRRAWGWDNPRIYWGEVLIGNTERGSGRGIYLRIAPQNIPSSLVVPIDADVQFSSDVVNLRIPNFGVSRIAGGEHDFDFQTVSRKFYEYFEDTYDVLAVALHEDHLTTYTAFHRTVKNDVSGVGESLFDASARYGSGGILKAFELYTRASLGDSEVTLHETAHQWGSFVDWGRLTGISRAGNQPEFHDPLWADRESFLSGLLSPTRRVAQVNGVWAVERTRTVATFHPLTRYAMGILPKEQVPDVILFDDQNQFEASKRPAVGSPVVGATRSATIYNVIGMLGERTGPTPSQWRRATIIVSRDRLLTQREMDSWTLIARRASDPNRTGTISFEGLPSFDLATDRAIDLQTTIRPKTIAPIEQSLNVDFPEFAATAWRGVTFDAPIKSRYAVGDRVEISGHVTARDRNDFHQALLLLYPDTSSAPAQELRARSQISSAGTFIFEFQLEAQHRGRHGMAVYLFWPDSGSQSPRSSLTTITVE